MMAAAPRTWVLLSVSTGCIFERNSGLPFGASNSLHGRVERASTESDSVDLALLAHELGEDGAGRLDVGISAILQCQRIIGEAHATETVT